MYYKEQGLPEQMMSNFFLILTYMYWNYIVPNCLYFVLCQCTLYDAMHRHRRYRDILMDCQDYNTNSQTHDTTVVPLPPTPPSRLSPCLSTLLVVVPAWLDNLVCHLLMPSRRSNDIVSFFFRQMKCWQENIFNVHDCQNSVTQSKEFSCSIVGGSNTKNFRMFTNMVNWRCI
jgi:hypothetical protein